MRIKIDLGVESVVHYEVWTKKTKKEPAWLVFMTLSEEEAKEYANQREPEYYDVIRVTHMRETI